MSHERLMERIRDYEKALHRLQEAMAQPENQFIDDAIIQRFEFTYELAWKAMKLWLEFKEIDTRNAKDTLREALQQGLINDGNAWSVLHEMRNLTSHTYDEKQARKVIDALRKDGLKLFITLADKWRAMDEA